MAKYRDAKQVFDVMGTTWRRAFEDPGFREKFQNLQMQVQFKLHEPEAELWLLADGSVHEGPWTGTSDKALVFMEMKGDIAHKFWCDDLNVPLATAKGDIKAKGPVAKIFGLIPLVKPVKKIYPTLCAEHGVARS